MAKKETKLPELFPFVVEGKEEFVNKAKYSKATAGLLAAKFKVDVSNKHITELLETAAAGKELDSGNEEQWYKIFDHVKADLERAREFATELAETEAQKKRDEELAAKQIEEIENQLVAVAEKTDFAATFNRLPELFDLGNMDRCVAKADVTDTELVAAVATSLKLDNFTNWMKGDLVLEAQKRGMEGVMLKMSQSTGIPIGSLWRMARTAQVITPETRKPDVSFTVYAEIATAKFSKEETENENIVRGLVDKIGTGEGEIGNSQKAREAVMAAQGKADKKGNAAGPNLEKDQFLVVTDAGVEVSTGLPKGLDWTDATIIHAKTCKRMEGKKWVELPKYEQPAIETETEKPATKAAPKSKKAAAKK